MWGYKVLIVVLLVYIICGNEYYKNCMGAVKTRYLVRSYIWWPSINTDVEEFAFNATYILVTDAFPSD